MTWSVYQHWDPLKVCVVGRSYPPEFYSWITIPHVRSLFEKIAMETEEDYQAVIKKLEQFGVEVMRPELPDKTMVNGKFVAPPMTPRDYTMMQGELFYENYSNRFRKAAYNSIKDASWPEINSITEFASLPTWIKHECKQVHNWDPMDSSTNTHRNVYDRILARIENQGNQIKSGTGYHGAECARVGKDLFFGTDDYHQDIDELRNKVNKEFTQTRNHIINTGGHSDATYCPVCPGLIISLYDVPTYASTFPGWEVVYLPGQSWGAVKPFLNLKRQNKGKWWIPGFEHDQSVIDVVETWLGHWTGYVEETVFDVNMLIIDPKNVIVFNYNKQVFDAFDRYGITPHIVPFRHRYFWDGGIHCITSDLHREGVMQDYFPERKNV